MSPPLLRFGTAATAAHWADMRDIHLLEKHHVQILAANKSRGKLFFWFFLPFFFFCHRGPM